MARRRHREITIRHGAIEADVDEGIAPVILETWRAGFQTEYSCQGSWVEWRRRKEAYLLFTTASDAAAWLRIVNPEPVVEERADGEFYTSDEEYQRWAMRTQGSQQLRWECSLLPWDWWKVRFAVSIRFPATDLADILARLKAHNAQARTARRTRRKAA